MNIALFSTKSNNHSFFVKNITEHLQPEHNIHIITPDEFNVPDCSIVDNTNLMSLIHRFFGNTISLEQLIYNIKLDSEYKKFKKYDVLWNTGGVFSALFCGKLSKKYNIPYIVTYYRPTTPSMLLTASTQPNAFITSNQRQQFYVELHNPSLSVHTIPPGIELNHFSVTKTHPSLKHVKHPIFLTRDPLYKHNKTENIIQAISRLDKGTLVVASEGPESRYIKALGEWLLGEERFVFLEPQLYNHSSPLYSSADIYITTLESEDYPRYALEALASNIPVIYNQNDNHSWFIDDGGIPVDTNDEETFAKRINTALYMEWKDKPKKRVEKFSVDRAVEQYNKLLDGFA